MLGWRNEWRLSARSRIATLSLVVLLLGGVRESAAEVDYSAPRGDEFWRFALAGPAVLALNTVIWIPSRLAGEDFADIHLLTLRDNIRAGYRWDENVFYPNQIGHPYHGGLYHSVPRALGLGFWQSIPYSVLGSLHWEFMMESKLPAANDHFMTMIGGISFGEALYRMSNLLLDDSTTGGERAIREAGAFVVNPVGGFQRLASGRMFRSGPAPTRRPFSWRLHTSLNGRAPGYPDALVHFGVGMELRYGDTLTLSPSFKPFERYNIEGDILAGSDILRFGLWTSIEGLLAAGHRKTERGRVFAGLMSSLEFFKRPALMAGGTGLGPGVMAAWQLGKRTRLDLVSAVFGVFGAAGNDYRRGTRLYNFGLGAQLKNKIGLSYEGAEVFVSDSRYWLKAIKGVSGQEVVSFLRAGVRLPMWGRSSVGFKTLWVDKRGFYPDFDDTRERALGYELDLSWTY